LVFIATHIYIDFFIYFEHEIDGHYSEPVLILWTDIVVLIA